MEYRSNLRNVLNAITDAEMETLESIGVFGEAEAKLRVKVDKGDLKRSVSNKVNENEKSVSIGSNKEYAIYKEKGTGIYAVDGNGRQTEWKYQDAEGNWHITKGQKPQPFLTPAIEENIGAIEDIVRSNFRLGE